MQPRGPWGAASGGAGHGRLEQSPRPQDRQHHAHLTAGGRPGQTLGPHLLLLHLTLERLGETESQKGLEPVPHPHQLCTGPSPWWPLCHVPS